MKIENPTTGLKKTRRVPRLDKDRNQVHTAAQAVEQLKPLQTQRADNALPVLERTPKFADYVSRYLNSFPADKESGVFVVQAQIPEKPFPSSRMTYPWAMKTRVSRDGAKTWTRIPSQPGENELNMEGGALELRDGTILAVALIDFGIRQETSGVDKDTAFLVDRCALSFEHMSL